MLGGVTMSPSPFLAHGLIPEACLGFYNWMLGVIAKITKDQDHMQVDNNEEYGLTLDSLFLR